MLDLTWKLFSQTGNVETYLLLKELEKEADVATAPSGSKNDETSPLNPEM